MTSTERPLWHQRDFRIAWSAGFVNDTGDWILRVALPTFVFVETGSGSATALLFVYQLLVGAVVGPFAGALVDRLDLRRCLVVTNLAQALAVVPLLWATPARVWPAYAVVVAQAVLTHVNNPANVSLVPRVVHPDRIAEGNAALAASASLARLVGAPIGGLLVAWRGLGPVVLIDAITFMAVAFSMTFVRADTAPRRDPDTNERASVRAGLRTIRAHPPLTSLLAIHGIEQIAQGGFIVLFVAFMVDELGDDGTWLGVIRGTMAIGALVGSILIGRLAKHFRPMLVYSAGMLGLGTMSALLWNAPAITRAFVVYLVLFALSGIPGSAMSVGLFTTIHTRAPAHAIGRVVGFMSTAAAIGSAAGAIVAGALVDTVALRPLLNAQAAIYLAAGLLAAAVGSRDQLDPTTTSTTQCSSPTQQR